MGFCKTMNMANTRGSIVLLLIFILGGFILPRTAIPNLWEWAYWLSPLSYGLEALSNNEFLASRWTNKRSTDNPTNLGFSVLKNLAIPTSGSTYWINADALLCFVCLFNILFTVSLMYMQVIAYELCKSVQLLLSPPNAQLLITSAMVTWSKLKFHTL
ncbi:ABC transporter G family member 35-like protein [Tanacetum coccineum]